MSPRAAVKMTGYYINTNVSWLAVRYPSVLFLFSLVLHIVRGMNVCMMHLGARFSIDSLGLHLLNCA